MQSTDTQTEGVVLGRAWQHGKERGRKASVRSTGTEAARNTLFAEHARRRGCGEVHREDATWKQAVRIKSRPPPRTSAVPQMVTLD